MLEYEIDLNKDEKDSPLVIFIHGFGANRFDLFGLKQLFPGYHAIALEAPYKMGFGQSHWYDIQWIGNSKIVNKEQAKESKNILINFIEKELNTIIENLDKNNITLFGFSQGGILSYAVASELNYIKKVFAISSYFDEDIAEINKLDNKNLSIFATHGLSDEVIPFSQAKQTQEKISKFDLKNYRFIEHPEGHCISQNIINEIVIWNNETD